VIRVHPIRIHTLIRNWRLRPTIGKRPNGGTSCTFALGDLEAIRAALGLPKE
jgi:hypothetical protein